MRSGARASRVALVCGVVLLVSASAVLAHAVKKTSSVRTRQPSESQRIEPSKLYEPHAFAPEVLRRIQRARDKSEIEDELWLMTEAAAGIPRNFELWDNLAELHCLAARAERREHGSTDTERSVIERQTGRALLREFRCAVAVAKGAQACFLPNPDGRLSPRGLGAVPNPAVAPLCFQALCGDAFRADARNKSVVPSRETLQWVDEDATNVDRIEMLCKEPSP